MAIYRTGLSRTTFGGGGYQEYGDTSGQVAQTYTDPFGLGITVKWYKPAEPTSTTSGGAAPNVNLNQASGAYGGVIPISMGIRRMPGQMIWATPIYGSDATGYFVNVAYCWGYNGDEDPSTTTFTRLWANGSKIWESNVALLPGAWSVTLYKGTTTQTADPTIVAAGGAATGYRGLMYGVFVGLPLATFNNSVPGISAEISGSIGGEIGPWGITDTLNPLDKNASLILSGGNLTMTTATFAWQAVRSVGSHSDGRYYYEAAVTHGAAHNATIGVADSGATLSNYIGSDDNGIALHLQAGTIYVFTNSVSTASGLSFVSGNTLGVDVDVDNRQIRFRNVSLNSDWSDWFAFHANTSSTVFAAGAISHNSCSIVFNLGATAFLGETTTTGTPTLVAFMRRVAEYAGLDPEVDLDFDPNITDDIAGGLIVADTDYGGFARNLARAFGFDIFEGQQIEFVKPVIGDTYVLDATLLPPDLLNEGDKAITTSRGEDSSPVQLELQYIDQTQQFRYQTQRARRILYPVRTTESRRRDMFAIPVVITANEALTLAGKAIFREAAQNVLHSFTLPPRYIGIEPGDVLSITAGSAVYTVKVTRMEVQADLAISIQAVNLLTDEDISLEGDSGNPLPDYEGAPLEPIGEGGGFVIVTGSATGTHGAAVTHTLNPSDKHADVGLSGGNLTATGNQGSGWRSVRSTSGYTTGRRYFEVTMGNTGNQFAGVADVDAGLAAFIGNDASGIGLHVADGNAWTNGGTTATGVAAVNNGEILGVDVDFDGATIAFRKVTGGGAWSSAIAWNAGTGNAGQTVYAGFSVAAGNILTVNFGATAFTGALPGSATAWNA